MPQIVRRDGNTRLSRTTEFGDLAFLFLSGSALPGTEPSFLGQTESVLHELGRMLTGVGSSTKHILQGLPHREGSQIAVGQADATRRRRPDPLASILLPQRRAVRWTKSQPVAITAPPKGHQFSEPSR